MCLNFMRNLRAGIPVFLLLSVLPFQNRSTGLADLHGFLAIHARQYSDQRLDQGNEYYLEGPKS